MRDEAFDLAPWFSGIARAWPRHLAQLLVAAAAMYAATFLMPRVFRATLTMLPPELAAEGRDGMPRMRFLDRMPSLIGSTRYYTPADLQVEMLGSRRVMEPVLQKFDMRAVYRTPTPEKTLLAFRRSMHAALQPDGTIQLNFDDRDARRAGAVANALIAELDAANLEIAHTRARRWEVYLDGQVARADSASREAEHRLEAYVRAHGVTVSPDREADQVSANSDLVSRRMVLQVQVDMLRQLQAAGTPERRAAEIEMNSLDQQLSRLPGLWSGVDRLQRDAEVARRVMEQLRLQRDDARLRSTVDTPTIVVLDAARPPERPLLPVRWLWATIAGALALLVSLLREGDERRGSQPAA